MQATRNSVLRKFGVVVSALALSIGLVACGGGSGGSTTAVADPTVNSLPPMVDSRGTAMPSSFDGGYASAMGADGGAGDGAAIPNAPVVIIDSAGHSVSGTTDVNGVYHLRIDGFVPPMIAKVTRPDGTVWHSPSISSPVVRGFVNMSVSGLTDYVASQVARAAGQNSSAQLTTAHIANNLNALAVAKSNLNSQLQALLTAAGLNASTFDPVTAILVTNHTGYDAVLDSVTVSNTPTTLTVINPLYTVGGSISGLGSSASGLILANGTDTLSVAAGSSTFTMPRRLQTNTAYNISVSNQPSGQTCSVSSGSGTMQIANVTSITVTCSANAFALGGSISGLGSATGLVLSNGSQAARYLPIRPLLYSVTYWLKAVHIR